MQYAPLQSLAEHQRPRWLSAQITSKHLFAPHLRNPAVLSKQNVKTLNVTSGILCFVQRSWEHSLLLPQTNVWKLDTPRTGAEKPTEKANNVPYIPNPPSVCTGGLLLTATPTPTKCKPVLQHVEGHLYNTLVGPALLRCGFAAYTLQSTCTNS